MYCNPRREATNPTRLTLGDWTDEFLGEFCETMQVNLSQKPRLVQKRRTISSALRSQPSSFKWYGTYATTPPGTARHAGGISVEIRLGRLTPSNRPLLEVAVPGPGIEQNAADRIFEACFTGRPGGTGLGLFIARELCQLSRAILLYEPRGRGWQHIQDRVQRPAALGGMTVRANLRRCGKYFATMPWAAH